MEMWDFSIIFGLLLLLLLLVALVIKLYLKLTTGFCTSTRRIDGHVAIVTGGNAGIGLETAKELANRGAHVILACRDLVKANAVCERLRLETKNGKIEVRELDTSSLSSVRKFADSVLKSEVKLDILVNNAGVAGLKRRITEDGLESQFCTNYFGPFLLTNLLIPLLEKSEGGRIVIVSSAMHHFGTDLDLNNLNAEKKWIGKKIYPWNKLCQILFMRELNRRLRDADSKITVNALHPGVVRTQIFNTAKSLFLLCVSVSWWFYKNTVEGAQTSIHLAVSEQVEGVSGHYWAECKKAKAAEISEDKELSRKLWEKSAELVKLKPNEYHLNNNQKLK